MEKITYLSGCVRREIVGMRGDLGFMVTPLMGNAPDLARVPWAADTGCFAQPERHDDDAYLAYLDRRPRETCLFATAPDVLGDAVATLERASGMLPRIRSLGFRAALVAQDGLERERIPWDDFDTLFIGGSISWKLGTAAYELGLEAKTRGKHLHWGRVNSLRRLSRAKKNGADSADGTFLAFGPDRRLPELCGWLDVVNGQGVLL